MLRCMPGSSRADEHGVGELVTVQTMSAPATAEATSVPCENEISGRRAGRAPRTAGPSPARRPTIRISRIAVGQHRVDMVLGLLAGSDDGQDRRARTREMPRGDALAAAVRTAVSRPAFIIAIADPCAASNNTTAP